MRAIEKVDWMMGGERQWMSGDVVSRGTKTNL